jgi:hypothetical protein
MESPHGVIKANPLYKINAQQSVAWRVPLYAHPPQQNTAELKAEVERLREALEWIAAHDLHGADLTVCGHIAHGFVGKARAALKETK